MKTDLIIGIDAGTSVIKAVAFNLSGEQIAQTSQKNHYSIFPDGAAEQDMTQTRQRTLATLKTLIDRLPTSQWRVIALAVTGQGSGNWMIDERGEPDSPASLWLDSRATAIVAEFRRSNREDKRFKICGTGLTACDQGPQWLWLKEKKPELLKKMTTAFHCKDWLYFCLTGRRATDPSEAIFSFGNFRTGEYSDEVLELLGLRAEKSLLPSIVDGVKTHHPLLSEIAGEIGVSSGIPVVLGYVDVVCSLLGTGFYDGSGSYGCSIVGSTGMHAVLRRSTAEVLLNAEKTGYTMALPIDHHYAQAQSNLSGTINLDWMFDLREPLLRERGVASQPSEPRYFPDEKILEAAAGEILYFPYISEVGERGPFVDPFARAGFLGLNTRHDYYDLARSVFEGLCLAAKDCYQTIGHLPDEIRLTGGGANSRALRRIFAAMLDRPVRVAGRTETGATGVAMIAAVSLGVYPNLRSCVERWVNPGLGEKEDPDPDLVHTYRHLYALYRETRQALTKSWSDLFQQQSKTSR